MVSGCVTSPGEEGEGQRPVPRRADVDIGRTGRGRLGLDAGLESLKCGWGGDRRIATLLGIDVLAKIANLGGYAG